MTPFLRVGFLARRRHDRKTVELYGAKAQVNFAYGALVDPATMKVHRMRTASGQEIPITTLPSGVEKAQVKVSEELHGSRRRHCGVSLRVTASPACGNHRRACFLTPLLFLRRGGGADRYWLHP